jgi:flagellar L-ring protein FlgH
MHAISARTAVCVLLSSVLLLAGCTTSPRRDPEFAVTLPPASSHPQPAYNGSIYQTGYTMFLFEDVRARRVGDILTVRLVENTVASKSQGASIDKSTSSSISEPTLLGTQVQYDLPNFVPLADQKNRGLASNIESNHSFEGSSDAAQRNSLSGDITVTVAEVLPNGQLFVRGEKRLNLTEGNEYVKIAGIVRPADIARDNSVESTRLADATVVYSGDGQNSSATKIGWLARFFTSALLPF